MSGQAFQCVSDGEEEVEDLILSPLLDDEGLDVNGTVRKNLLDAFVPDNTKSSVTDQEPPGREHMKVYLRVRPFLESELAASEDQGCVEIENEKAVVMHAPHDSFAFKNSSRGVGETTHRFTFSRVFDEQTSQKSFFDDTTLGMIKDFVDGQNCLVFTYGVTNSGKVFQIHMYRLALFIPTYCSLDKLQNYHANDPHITHSCVFLASIYKCIVFSTRVTSPRDIVYSLLIKTTVYVGRLVDIMNYKI